MKSRCFSYTMNSKRVEVWKTSKKQCEWDMLLYRICQFLIVSTVCEAASYLVSRNAPIQERNFQANHFPSSPSEGGFFLDEVAAVVKLVYLIYFQYICYMKLVHFYIVRSDVLECPSNSVISTKYKCQVKSKWVDCYRRHCCQGYNFVAGRYYTHRSIIYFQVFSLYR